MTYWYWEETDLEPNLTSKASSIGENYPRSYKEITTPFLHQCGTLNTLTPRIRHLEHEQYNMWAHHWVSQEQKWIWLWYHEKKWTLGSLIQKADLRGEDYSKTIIRRQQCISFMNVGHLTWSFMRLTNCYSKLCSDYFSYTANLKLFAKFYMVIIFLNAAN